MLKRVVIASIFLALNALFLTGIYFVFLKAPETCFDGKQNQNEQGIDCGGVCALVCREIVVGKEFQVTEIAFVSGGQDVYDVLGMVYNPSDDIGASSFRYLFELKDSDGQVLATRSGKSFLLPRQRKNIIESNLETTGTPVTASLTFQAVAWERSRGYQEAPAIGIYQKNYTELSEGFGFSQATGVFTNESSYDFRSIFVQVILRDSLGKPIAFNKTKQDTVRAGESRDFKLIWPNRFSGTVDRIDMEVDADVYHSENFVKQYFPEGLR